MMINGVLYKWLRAARSGEVRVHLGPGQRNYLQGWVNVDANMFTGKCDVWADLRNPLPFPRNTVAACYSHHVIEHLPDVRQHLAEVFRCLRSGGVYRVAGPNGDAAMAKYVAGDASWFGDFPDKRRSLGGKLENFVFVRQEHLTILTYSYLEELLEDAGFKGITPRLPCRDTGFPVLFSDCLAKEAENDFDTPHTLVIEAVKP